MSLRTDCITCSKLSSGFVCRAYALKSPRSVLIVTTGINTKTLTKNPPQIATEQHLPRIQGRPPGFWWVTLSTVVSGYFPSTSNQVTMSCCRVQMLWSCINSSSPFLKSKKSRLGRGVNRRSFSLTFLLGMTDQDETVVCGGMSGWLQMRLYRFI